MHAPIVAGLCAAFFLGVAPAFTGPAAQRDSDPDWIQKPSYEDLRAVWPSAAIKKGLDGTVRIRCRVTAEGLLDRCVVVTEEPAGLGYGAAALALTNQFRMRPKVVNGEAVEGGTVVIPIRFRGAANVALSQTEKVLLRTHWRTAPTKADVLAAYPSKAHGASGRVLLQCKFRKDGSIEACESIWRETPGRGFDEAARGLVKLFKGPTSLVNGDPVGGLRVRVPVYFGANGVTPKSDPDSLAASIRLADDVDPKFADALFPEPAKVAKLSTGAATLVCVVKPQGALGDCKVLSEAPAGMGFGDAALRAAPAYRTDPWTFDGRAVDGEEVRVKLRFDNPDLPAKP